MGRHHDREARMRSGVRDAVAAVSAIVAGVASDFGTCRASAWRSQMSEPVCERSSRNDSRKGARSMNRPRDLFLALLLATAAPGSAWAQAGIQYDKIEIKTDRVAPNLYMLSG